MAHFESILFLGISQLRSQGLEVDKVHN